MLSFLSRGLIFFNVKPTSVFNLCKNIIYRQFLPYIIAHIVALNSRVNSLLRFS